jgi:glutathionyl-hydroquinone reductase
MMIIVFIGCKYTHKPLIIRHIWGKPMIICHTVHYLSLCGRRGWGFTGEFAGA